MPFSGGLQCAALGISECVAFLGKSGKAPARIEPDVPRTQEVLKKGPFNPSIKKMTERCFAKKYNLGDQVMESGHPGMKVLFATRLSDGLSIVIKSRDKSCSFKSSREEVTWRHTMESQLKMPKMETICELMEVIETEAQYYVVMERINGKDLLDTIMDESVSHLDTRDIVGQILVALENMHGLGRIHKDLKMENVMIDHSPRGGRRLSVSMYAGVPTDYASPPTSPGRFASPKSPNSNMFPSVNSNFSSFSNMSAKIIDFDTVEDWEPESPRAKDVLGTNGYIAPEAYKGNYSPASDIYCVGVIMYALLTSRMPFDRNLFDDKPGENIVGGPAMARIYNRLRSQKIDFDREPFIQCSEAADLCKSLLAFSPDSRPSAAEALNHPWFGLSPDSLPC